MSSSQKIRVLHIFGKMDRGGAETWIVNVLRAIDRSRFQFDFLVQAEEKGAYDEEILRLGGRILHSPSRSQPLQYATGLLRILRQYGQYNVVHSHVHHFSGVNLLLARLAGVPVRIAHSHSDISYVVKRTNLARRMYYKLTSALIRRFATVGIGSSSDAARSLFGASWDADERVSILYCGIDCEPFRRNVDRVGIRRSYGIDEDTLVIGHVGRFAPMKNHQFLLQVFCKIVEARPNSRLALVGDGPLRPHIEQRAEELGVQDRVLFLGSQADVSLYLLGMCDVFVFPSLYEGLGIAVIEAQAASLPAVVSDSIPNEADVVPGLVHRMSHSHDADMWAQRILAVAVEARNVEDSLRIVQESDFNLDHGLERLVRIYEARSDVDA